MVITAKFPMFSQSLSPAPLCNVLSFSCRFVALARILYKWSYTACALSYMASVAHYLFRVLNHVLT